MRYYRQHHFLPQLNKFRHRMQTWGDDGNIVEPELKEGESKAVPLYHDEMCINSNDSSSYFYVHDSEEQTTKAFTRGSSVMVSGIFCPCHGFVEVDGKRSYTTLEIGKGKEGYYDANMFCKDITELLPLFRTIHPDAELVLLLDNSSGHQARAKDALWAKNLRFNDGFKGKSTTFMRDTSFVCRNTGAIIQQSMRNANGQQKGVKTLLQDRDMWETMSQTPGVKYKDLKHRCSVCKRGRNADPQDKKGKAIDCCLEFVLSRQPDFAATKPRIMEEVDKLNDKKIFILFLPKFHCELNPIELIWAHIKNHFRRNCKFDFTLLKEELPIFMNNIDVTIFQKCYMHSNKYVDAYSRNIEGQLLIYVMRKQRGHRKLPQGEELERILQQFRDQQLAARVGRNAAVPMAVVEMPEPEVRLRLTACSPPCVY